MPNRSYLCVTDHHTIYPAMNQDFDSETQILADGVRQIPLLWLALFRRDSVQDKTIQPSSLLACNR